MLQSFVLLCPALFPDVIPVYITYDKENPSIDERTTILDTVVPIVNKSLKIDIAKDFEDEYIGDKLISALDEKGKYLFLIVDEVDQLYRQDPRKEFAKVHNSLKQLAWMANDTRGKIAIFACGSSASCCLLVTCNGDRNEFPALVGAANLNSQKFGTLRLPAHVFTDVNVIENITEPGSLELRRLLAFGVGINPRKILTALHYGN